MREHDTRAETVCATGSDEPDEYLAQAVIGIVAEYEAISQARRALAAELQTASVESSQAETGEMWTAFIDDLRAHAEYCGALSDRATNASAKFLLAVYAFELMQEAEVLDHFRSSTTKARQPFPHYFGTKRVNSKDLERALRGKMDSGRERAAV